MCRRRAKPIHLLAHRDRRHQQRAWAAEGFQHYLQRQCGCPRGGRDLELHPKIGASWEGYAIEEIIKAVRPDDAYFWATHQGAELDLLMIDGGKRFGVEVKRQDAPGLTPSMRIALADLKLEHLTVLYPGSRRYALADRVTVVPLAELAKGDQATIFPRTARGRARGSPTKRRVPRASRNRS